MGVGVGAGASFFAAEAKPTREIANNTTRKILKILFIPLPPKVCKDFIPFKSFVNTLHLGIDE